MTPLPPWANGPFELLLHAEEHLRAGDDFDRRIALISFDNALETTISVYLLLKPIFRGNKRYDEKEVNKWLNNYYTRLEFFEIELINRNIKWKVEKNFIAYSHEHRNEQYHGGDKGIPGKDILDIARNAAIWVFGVLFDVPDIEERLAKASEAKLPLPPPERNSTYDDLIDANFETLDVGGQRYSVSEILYLLDYEAYRNLGNELLEVTQTSEEVIPDAVQARIR